MSIDPRFQRLRSDPRFRRPKKKHAKLEVDERFKDIFASSKQKKGKSVRVDKYGRSVSVTHDQDNLKRYYNFDVEDEISLPDYARGQVLLESSDEEEDDANRSLDEESDTESTIVIGADHDTFKDDVEVDLDESNFADLDAQAAAYSKRHPEQPDDPLTQTNRLAAVNLDWDHVRATHLYKICSSLLSPTAPLSTHVTRGQHEPSRPSEQVARGRVLHVRVYPSDYGRERMAREEQEGPPKEIFKKRKEIASPEEIIASDLYDLGDGAECDEDALRTYQIDRLRYYYAIITFDTTEAAVHVLRELQGTEFERSANIFDFSFVPDDMTFDQEFRDEATGESIVNYKNIDFVTDALRHSKVKLTWDEDDSERNQLTRRRLTPKEIEDADFRTLLASSSESEDNDVSLARGGNKMSRDKVRTLLLGGDHELPEGWGDDNDEGDVDMEVTFTPGLSEQRDSDETTLEKYQRKMREKRKKRKEESKARMDRPAPQPEDDFFEVSNNEAQAEDLESLSKADQKMKKKRHTSESLPKASRQVLSTAEGLDHLLSSNDSTFEPKHFDMKAILKVEKNSERKRKSRKKTNIVDHDLQDDFKIDVEDDRFKAIHENHEFAIDPSNPHFKKTKSMKALLNERARRHQENGTAESGKDLASLVESVKRKSAFVKKEPNKRRRA